MKQQKATQKQESGLVCEKIKFHQIVNEYIYVEKIYTTDKDKITIK